MHFTLPGSQVWQQGGQWRVFENIAQVMLPLLPNHSSGNTTILTSAIMLLLSALRCHACNRVALTFWCCSCAGYITTAFVCLRHVQLLPLFHEHNKPNDLL